MVFSTEMNVRASELYRVGFFICLLGLFNTKVRNKKYLRVCYGHGTDVVGIFLP